MDSSTHTNSTKSRIRDSVTGVACKRPGDSQEWIVDPQNPMVIRQSTRIDVTVEGLGSDPTRDDSAPSYQVTAEAERNSN